MLAAAALAAGCAAEQPAPAVTEVRVPLYAMNEDRNVGTHLDGAGEVFTPANVRSIRPGFGLAPRHMDGVLGHRATQAIPRGTPLHWTLVSES